MGDSASTDTLLDVLADLPLAIKQASAYIAKTSISTAKYLALQQAGDKNSIALLSRDFEDRGRYKTTENPITATWLISFEHITRDAPLAAQYLKFMCFLAEKDIPVGLLPSVETGEDWQADEGISPEVEGLVWGKTPYPVTPLPPGDDDCQGIGAIGVLKAYAFVTERKSPGHVDIHRLVQLATRNWIDNRGGLETCTTSVIQRLDEAFPDRPDYQNKEV